MTSFGRDAQTTGLVFLQTTQSRPLEATSSERRLRIYMSSLCGLGTDHLAELSAVSIHHTILETRRTSLTQEP